MATWKPASTRRHVQVLVAQFDFNRIDFFFRKIKSCPFGKFHTFFRCDDFSHALLEILVVFYFLEKCFFAFKGHVFFSFFGYGVMVFMDKLLMAITARTMP
jgi:hypothetical protein